MDASYIPNEINQYLYLILRIYIYILANIFSSKKIHTVNE